MKRFKMRKLNNDGAALILAIMIVMFITILTTLLLYVAGINYQMKTTDYNTKVSFYGAEIPLEELKRQLAVDTAKASENAYEYVLKNFGALNNPDARSAAFQTMFFDELEGIWNDRMSGGSWIDAMDAVLNPDASNREYDILFDSGSINEDFDYHVILGQPDGGVGNSGIRWERDESSGDSRIFLRDITVEYEKNGYLSVISTDFCINVPRFDWSVEKNEIPDTGVPADAKRETLNFESSVSYVDWTKQ